MKPNALAAALAAAFTFAATPVLAAATAPESTLTVTGQGVVSRAPDQAVVTVTLVTNNEVAARALSDNNTRYNDLATKAGAAGIAAANLRTTNLNTYYNPRPQEPSPNVAQRFGYVVSRSVQITVNALATTGAVIDAATAAGATNVGGVSYGFRDPRAMNRLALGAAVDDAFEQARTIAAAAHVRIVRVQHIGNDGGGRPLPLQTFDTFARAAPAPESPPVPTVLPASTLDVRSTITVTYVIAG
ncbi:MAG: SIMPL domain-containing protein [Candidatus Velthaea sp.]